MIRKKVTCKGSMTALWSLVFLLLTGLPISIFAQSGETRGVVRDASGQPISNVNVMLKDGKSGSITDAKGVFVIRDLPSGAVLVISGVGFETQEVALEGRRSLNITLQQDAASLDDVVVVGYGRQRKVTKTGAVSEIKGDDIRRTPSASLQNTLQGRLPGFFSVQRSGRPGADGADFFIRGISTFAENSQQPYILVDDIEYSYAQFSRIDPNEVENITILKDAATTAIYGIKGANGVILVTTRRGKVGKPVVTFRSQLGAQVPVKPFKFLNSYETALLRNESLVNEGLQPQFNQADLDAFRDGTDPYRHPNINWYDELIRKYTLQAQQNVDISGGSERAKYFISMGYLSQNGIVKDFDAPSIYDQDKVNNNYYYKRYNFRSNLDIAATERLNLKLDVSGNFDERNGPSAVGYGIFYEIAHYEQLPPFAYNIYNPDGTYGFSDGLLVPKPAEGNNNNVVGRIAMGGYSRNYGNQFNFNLSGVQKLDQLIPGLSARVTTAFTSTNTATRSLSRGGGFPAFAYNPLTNTYLPRDVNVFRVSPLALSYSGGSPVRNLTMQGSLNYDRTIGAHGINALFLYNQTSQYFATGDRNTNYIPSKLRGFTFRTAYNFRQKYMLELNGALNGTDRFVTQERYGFFPAVSVGYNLAKEDWVQKNLPALDVLKLRGSWGLVGDDGVSAGSRYLYEEIYNRTLGMAFFGETPNSLAGIREGTLGNDDVSWQKERKTNVALDFSLWNGLFSGSVDVFDNFRYDILRARNTVPIYFGIATVPPVNLGKVKNRGYEVELTHRHKIGKLGYSLRGTLSFAKNTIVEIDEPPAKYPWLKQTGTSIGTTRMWMWDGFYQNQADIDTSAKPSGVIRPGFLKYRDLNGDKIINDDDRMFYGEPNIPNTNYGINLTLNYKGFSLNALFQGATGYNFNVGWRLATPFKANLSELHQKRWTPSKGNDAEFPLLISNFNATYMSPTDNQISTFWSMRSSYLRFRSMELGWDVPTSWLGRMKLSSARFTISGFNLWTWSNVFRKYQYDPETVGNVAEDVYPQQRLYNAGLNITFK